jgi:hypothetical protein
MRKFNTIRGAVASAIAALALVGCSDILDVQDPQRYTADDLDTALPAVANGVEGAVHEVIDTWVVYQALLSDVYQHTGTWAGYDETDHGRFQYGTSAMDGTQNSLLRARWFAQDAEDRFSRVLGESEAASSPLTAQVRLGGAMADLYMGMAYCEAPAENDGPAVSDMQILQQAEQKFTAAIQTAQSAGATDFMTAAIAGRATARLMLGDYSGAAADAAQIPDGFSYDAGFNQASDNWVVLVTTKTFNEAAGLMYKWWDLIDISDSPGYMRDPWTDAPDSRIPVYFDGEVATDNETPHYSQWKYNNTTDDIPMVHSDGMRLIQAEVMMRNGDYAGATAMLNSLRAAVGLDPFDVPTDEDTMRDYLLSERFAEHFMEGMRMVDLYRFGLVRETFEEIEQIAIDKGGDLSDEVGQRPATGRPTKFTLTDDEATYNVNIVNDLLQRCFPRS